MKCCVREGGREMERRPLAGCLAGLAIALIVVGLVSGTILRHIVQIVPVVTAGIVVIRRPAIGAYAALPIFIFWMFIVSLIWLFLAGLSRIANGHYTIPEIISTIVMAACCGYGVIRAIPIGRPSPVGWRIATFLGFAALQFVAMWISFMPSVANR